MTRDARSQPGVMPSLTVISVHALIARHWNSSAKTQKDCRPRGQIRGHPIRGVATPLPLTPPNRRIRWPSVHEKHAAEAWKQANLNGTKKPDGAFFRGGGGPRTALKASSTDQGFQSRRDRARNGRSSHDRKTATAADRGPGGPRARTESAHLTTRGRRRTPPLSGAAGAWDVIPSLDLFTLVPPPVLLLTAGHSLSPASVCHPLQPHQSSTSASNLLISCICCRKRLSLRASKSSPPKPKVGIPGISNPVSAFGPVRP